MKHSNLFVDVHSHIIFNVDDGAASIEEAIALIKMDYEEGARVIYASPHYGIENGYSPKKNVVLKRFNQLCKSVPDVELRLGTEWYCSEDIVQRIMRKEAWPMGDSDYYMVEFLEYGELTEPEEVILRRLKKLKDSSINVILAHPERYKAVQLNKNLAKRICDMGVLLQVNAYDIALNSNARTRSTAQWLAAEGLVSFIGSDMHGLPPKRTPRMKEGIQWLIDNAPDTKSILMADKIS